MRLNEEPNTPDPMRAAFQQMVDAIMLPGDDEPVDRNEVIRDAADEARAYLADVDEAMDGLIRDLHEVRALMLEIRQLRRSDNYRPEI
jgi:hypothetical protein